MINNRIFLIINKYFNLINILQIKTLLLSDKFLDIAYYKIIHTCFLLLVWIESERSEIWTGTCMMIAIIIEKEKKTSQDHFHARQDRSLIKLLNSHNGNNVYILVYYILLLFIDNKRCLKDKLFVIQLDHRACRSIYIYISYLYWF
jgi:hypothetical protein